MVWQKTLTNPRNPRFNARSLTARRPENTGLTVSRDGYFSASHARNKPSGSTSSQ
jgi:hypothetical protein